MLLFRGEEHVDRWCRARFVARGYTMTVQQCWTLARRWYEPRIQPDWRRFTADEAEAIFKDIGLTGEFWALR